MKAFPFGIPAVVGTVVTASAALSSSYISATIVTASIALNWRGPMGPDGTTTVVTGPQGVQGPQGPSGSAGLGIYLLSSSLATCPGF